MSKNMCQGVEDTILALFEEFSEKHSWCAESSKNIHYYNGWKTNQAWKINKKVIIPLNGFYDLDYSWGGFRPTDYKVLRKLEDIEKVFNYLDGGITPEVDAARSLKRAEVHGETKKIALKYFHVTFYKKGTCHIEFDNAELLKKFNIFGSRRKHWLPPAYGKTVYKDMNSTDRAVVDAFEGEAAYQKTMGNRGYYLFDAASLPLLGGDRRQSA